MHYLENYEEYKDSYLLKDLKNDSEFKQMVQEVSRKTSEIENCIKNGGRFALFILPRYVCRFRICQW